MDSSINFVYKYSAGTKTIDGIFPVYNLDGAIVCKKTDVLTEKNKKRFENNYETEPFVLLAAESNDDETFEFFVTINQIDYNILT
jgi:hypothetical protein